LPLLGLLRAAWEVEEFRIVGPSWLAGSADRFAVIATMPPEKAAFAEMRSDAAHAP
jgi:uncharacterized protein (TIGR03435 family)